MSIRSGDLLNISEIEIATFGKPGSGKSSFYRWLKAELARHGLEVSTLDPEQRLIRITRKVATP